MAYFLAKINPKKKPKKKRNKNYHLATHERAKIIHFCDENLGMSWAEKTRKLKKILNREILNYTTIVNTMRNREAILNMATQTDKLCTLNLGSIPPPDDPSI